MIYKIFLNKYLFVALLVLCFMTLVSCGSDTTSETTTGNSGIEHRGNFDAVHDISGLPKCDDDNNGLQVFIESDRTIRVCADGDWFAVQNGTVADSTIIISSKCTTEPLADSNGVKILCNGDSVGVVFNGQNGLDGSKGKDGEQGAPGEQGDPGSKGADGSNGTGCTVVTLPDNMGLKVICGGDSVGVVLNGKDGQDHVARCELVSLNCMMNVACGSDTVSLNVAAKDEGCNALVSLDSEAIALNLEGIGGSSQKGPFLTGSEVVAYELLNGRSLQQTGKTFQGKILNDKGYFDIKTVSLASQYAVLMAKGYFLNEVTGKPSASQITLNALTNLRGRAVANINLLTHLENERAQYLVIMGKKSVAAAKKLAEAEVFNLFHIDSKDFGGYSEDLSVGGTSDADAALLAMSILLQGNRSEAELSNLITSISTAMEKTGKWDDEETKLKIADWAMEADTSGKLVKFRENVTNWKLSQMVAKFEPYFRHFWNVEYGLGECATGESSDTVGTTKKPTRGSVNSDVWFTCVDSSDADVGKVWRIATDFEKNTYLLKAVRDGQVSWGYVNSENFIMDDEHFYVYDKSANAWRVSGDEYELSLGGCTKGRQGEYGEIKDKIYECQSEKWVYTYNVVELNETCDPNDSGKMSWGTSATNKMFVCENAKWRNATESEMLRGVACTASMRDSIRNIDGVDYICNPNVWSVYTPPEPEEEPEPELCDYAIGEMDYFSTKESANYIDTLFVDPRDGKKYKLVRIIIGDYDRVWFAENLRFADSASYRNLQGQSRCYKEKNGDCTIGGRFYTWSAAMNLSQKWQNSAPEDIDALIDYPHQGICPSGWHLPDSLEYLNLYNVVKRVNSLKDKSTGDDTYGFTALSVGVSGCTSGRNPSFWTSTVYHGRASNYTEDKMSGAMFFGIKSNNFLIDNYSRKTLLSIRCVQDLPNEFESMVCEKKGTIVSGITNPDRKYVCDADTFRVVLPLEKRIELGCTSYNEGTSKIVDGVGYLCEKSQWVEE